MTIQNPVNDVVITNKGGGAWSLELNGYDLAPHVTDWTLTPEEGFAGNPDAYLTVKIPCERLTLRGESPR